MRICDGVIKPNIIKRAGAAFMAFVIFLSCSITVLPVRAKAAEKTLTIKAARSLALQCSSEYDSAEADVIAKRSSYESSVKAIALKEKDLTTFRWSPLLNFKFPQSLSFDQASEFKYKPIALSYEVQKAEHKMQDKVFEIDEKVNNLYCEIVVLQETIAFNEKRLSKVDEDLGRNQAKVRTGQVAKEEVEKLEKKKQTLNDKIAADKRSLSADLQKLSKMVGIDVTTGYKFEKPFVEATIDRSMLESITQYTLDRDETYYQACIEETTKRVELQTNADLIKNKFGGDYNIIASYVTAALNGSEVSKKAFSAAYKDFIKKIDSYWAGEIKILFFSFSMEWFKGDLDGTRYIEDDPNVLETNVLDYITATKSKKATGEELEQKVTDYFNNYISVRNSYNQYLKDVAKEEKELDKSLSLNRTGKLSFDEYDSQMDSYEELQNSMLDAMKLYTTTLYGFDRLTCGGISAILSGTDADLQTAVVGEHYPEKNVIKGARYTLKSIIQNQEFELAVIIPDGFELEITEYELWVNGEKVGEKTPKDKKLRHLALAVDGVKEAKVRLYNGEEFVDDCKIDPSVESGELPITTYNVKKNEGTRIGTYTASVNNTTGILEVKFTMESQDIKKFTVKTEDGTIVGDAKNLDIAKPFKHISQVQKSLEDLKIEFLDESGAVLYKARFDVANSAILKEDEE